MTITIDHETKRDGIKILQDNNLTASGFIELKFKELIYKDKEEKNGIVS